MTQQTLSPNTGEIPRPRLADDPTRNLAALYAAPPRSPLGRPDLADTVIQPMPPLPPRA